MRLGARYADRPSLGIASAALTNKTRHLPLSRGRGDFGSQQMSEYVSKLYRNSILYASNTAPG